MIIKHLLIGMLVAGPITMGSGCGGAEEKEVVAQEEPAAVTVADPEPERAADVPTEVPEELIPEAPAVVEMPSDSVAEVAALVFPEIPLPALPRPESRKAAPELTLKDLAGRGLSLQDLRGEVVLINFWATWCPPCKKEIPRLIQLQEIYGPAGFRVLGLSIDQNGLAAVKPFVGARKEINYTIIPNGRRAAQAFGGINSIPTTFVLDREGRIVYKLRGYDTANTLEGYVQAALRERPPEPPPEPIEAQADSTIEY